MPTIFTHPVVAVGLSSSLVFHEKHKQIMFMAMLLTILPDIDVIGFYYGIPYLHTFGHRGFTHSIFFAVLSSLLAAVLIIRNSTLSLKPVWFYFLLCAASHGLLDAVTNGGHGIAFWSPFSNERFFFEIQPVEVSTLNIKKFFAGQGNTVLSSEIRWIWVPFLEFYVLVKLGRKCTRMIKKIVINN